MTMTNFSVIPKPMYEQWSCTQCVPLAGIHPAVGFFVAASCIRKFWPLSERIRQDVYAKGGTLRW